MYETTNNEDVYDIHKLKISIKKDISSLSETQYEEILKIISSSSNKYSENNNGIFINLKNVDDDTTIRIYKYISSIKSQNNSLSKLATTVSKSKNEKLTNSDNNESLLSFDKIDSNQLFSELKQISQQTNKDDEKFSFQNFLDKMTITSQKTFHATEKIIYPTLKPQKNKYVNGIKARLLKKCKYVNKHIEYANPDTEETEDYEQYISTINTDTNAEDVDSLESNSDCSEDDIDIED